MMITRPGLTPCQQAVLDACREHARSNFLPVTPKAWWRAGPPFHGSQVTFGRHLRILELKGMLVRVDGGYQLTSTAEAALTPAA